jgi:hypothetical protein
MCALAIGTALRVHTLVGEAIGGDNRIGHDLLQCVCVCARARLLLCVDVGVCVCASVC